MKKVLAAVAVAMTLPMTVMAWEPTGDVNVIVAYKAGSGTDTGALSSCYRSPEVHSENHHHSEPSRC